ncbi:trace amine-associated receptor 1-like, partial [Tachysurus ichikawai]
IRGQQRGDIESSNGKSRGFIRCLNNRRRETIHLAREDGLGWGEQPALRWVKVSGDGWLDHGGIAHAQTRHILHLKPRETVFLVKQITPAIPYVFRTCREDGQELLSRAGRRPQKLAVIYIPLLIRSIQESRPFDVEPRGSTFTKLQQYRLRWGGGSLRGRGRRDGYLVIRAIEKAVGR